jgi:hypothetical protein
MRFFDQAAYGVFTLPGGAVFLDGWVSLFGIIDGGTYFHTDLMDSGLTQTASIWWNFTGSDDYFLMYISLYERADVMVLGSPFPERIFQVPWDERFESGPQTLTASEGRYISGISFYGANRIPEPSSVVLLTVGLIGIRLKFARRA